jgi:hypothetical protein
VSARQHKEFNKESRNPKCRWQQQLCRFHQAAPKIASRDTTFFQERFEAMSLTYRRGSKLSRDNPMTILPVDRALSIYGTLADRSEPKGARERLSRHLMKIYIDGEQDEHRLTVHGLSYLRDLDREIYSRS